jgi:hypothetical protein
LYTLMTPIIVYFIINDDNKTNKIKMYIMSK